MKFLVSTILKLSPKSGSFKDVVDHPSAISDSQAASNVTVTNESDSPKGVLCCPQWSCLIWPNAEFIFYCVCYRIFVYICVFINCVCVHVWCILMHTGVSSAEAVIPFFFLHMIEYCHWVIYFDSKCAGEEDGFKDRRLSWAHPHEIWIVFHWVIPGVRNVTNEGKGFTCNIIS